MRMAAVAVLLLLPLAACAPDLTPPPLPKPPSSEPPPPPPSPGQGDYSTRTFHRPLSAIDAEQILMRTEIFAYGGMNNFPHPEAFDVLMHRPDALEIARRLATGARPAGRLFALCMLKQLEARPNARANRPESYEIEKLAIELAESPGRVEHLESDVFAMLTMPELVVKILNRGIWRYVVSMGGLPQQPRPPKSVIPTAGR